MRILFSGGGTGGHLFPALAVANELKMHNDAEIFFIGTPHKIESRVVPASGYNFEPLEMKGLPRKNIIKIFLYFFGFGKSLLKAVKLVKKISPDIAIGSGGYVSVPPLLAARWLGVPLVLMEQNSVPGLATKLLQRFAQVIHLNYEDSLNYINNKEKAKVTGNPVRESGALLNSVEAKNKLGVPADKPLLLILGGSLGATSMNKHISKTIKGLSEEDIYTVWQTGSNDLSTYENRNNDLIRVVAFIEDMNTAYMAADIVICRAGATTISELAFYGKPAILIPSPNVANDHQTGNALSLVKKDAALMIKESNVEAELVNTFISLFADKAGQTALCEAIKQFSKPDAAKLIAESVVGLYNSRRVKNV